MRRNAILEAAQIEFAERGFARAKLEDIAKRAEFGKGTLYNYFKGGKLGMLFAIFDRLYDNIAELIEDSFAPDRMEERSFRDNLYDYTVSCLSFYLDSRDIFLILVKEAHRMCFGEDQENASYFRDQQERIVKALQIPIQWAIDAGQIRSIDASAVAYMILGNIQGVQMRLILDSEGQDSDYKAQKAAEASQFLTTMLIDGLAHPDHRIVPEQQSMTQPSANGSHA